MVVQKQINIIPGLPKLFDEGVVLSWSCQVRVNKLDVQTKHNTGFTSVWLEKMELFYD